MTETGGRRVHRYRVPGLAVLLIGGLYLPFLGVPFEYDDKVEIVFNQVLRHPGDIQEMWTYNPFRVLLLYTFAADIWAWGLVRPEGYRAVNIAVHALNSVLLWWPDFPAVVIKIKYTIFANTFRKRRQLQNSKLQGM